MNDYNYNMYNHVKLLFIIYNHYILIYIYIYITMAAAAKRRV